jgi:tetratricopeptide (TPR) repeat protein
MKGRRAPRLAALLIVGTMAGCAPKVAPPPSAASLRYPDFVFPAPPPALSRAVEAPRVLRGWELLQTGDTPGARQEFTAALRADAAYYPADAALGYVSMAERRYADAVDRFSRALRRNPRYVPALVGRGDALAGAGRVDDALADLQAAVAADPSLGDVRRRMEVLAFRRQQEQLQAARSAAAAGRLDEAAEDYQRAIARSPDSPLLYRELAEIERRQGRLAQAAASLRKAASLEPSDARTLVLLGEVLEAQGDFAGAADAYDRAAALEPDAAVSARAAEARARGHVSRLPEPFQAIPKAARITRGELAALIGVRLGSLLETAPHRNAVVLTDVRGNWAAGWIMAVVRAGVMEPYPNHAFRPGDPVTRVDLARVASRVLELIAARQPKLGQAWRAAHPRIADVPPDHLWYPAVALVVAAGAMPLSEGGAFMPTRPVSGVEAVDVVSRLEGLLR